MPAPASRGSRCIHVDFLKGPGADLGVDGKMHLDLRGFSHIKIFGGQAVKETQYRNERPKNFKELVA